MLPILRTLRGEGIASEIYPEAGKMKKQMEYANRRGIPYVVIVGSQELEARAATVKDMRTGIGQNVAPVLAVADRVGRIAVLAVGVGRDAAQQQDQQAPEDHGMTFAERHPEKVQPGLLRHMRKRAGRGAGEGRSRRGALAVADAFAGRGLAVHAQGMFREVVGSGSIQTQLGRSLPGTFGIIDLHGSVRVKNAGRAVKVRPLPQRDRLQGHAALDAPERAVRQAGNASRP